MTEAFDWQKAIADLPAPPDPIGFRPRDPHLPAVREPRGERLTRQIAELKEYKAKVHDLLKKLHDIEDVPEDTKMYWADVHSQTSRALRQYLWREANFTDPEDRKGVGITLHLKPSEIAVLDWIARHLRNTHPIDRDDEPTNWVPSRAQAVRELIDRYVGRWDDHIPLEDLIDSQERWGMFWVREASWRRASVKKKAAGLVNPPLMPL